MYKRPPRLKFTDEERGNPELQKKVQKADKAADKANSAQGKIPSRKKLKADVVPDPKSGKLQVKLQFEESRKKPPSKLTHAVQTAPVETVRGQLHKEVRETEDDNVGVEAAHSLEQSAERTSQVLHAGYRSHKLKPYREAAKAEQKLDKANLDALQKKMELDHPTSNPFSKFQQRQAIKRQYAAAKASASTGTTQTAASITEKAAQKATETSKKTATFVKKHSKAFLVILGFLMLLGFFLSGLSSCTVVMEGVISGIASSTYASTDDSIQGAEAAYCAMEAALQSKLDNYESTHSYDDYIYDLDEIGHDPYVLTSILSALHPGEWTLPEVMGTLDMLFEKQYILTEEVETETRYRTETLTGERHAQDPTGERLQKSLCSSASLRRGISIAFSLLKAKALFRSASKGKSDKETMASCFLLSSSFSLSSAEISSEKAAFAKIWSYSFLRMIPRPKAFSMIRATGHFSQGTS